MNTNSSKKKTKKELMTNMALSMNPNKKQYKEKDNNHQLKLVNEDEEYNSDDDIIINQKAIENTDQEDSKIYYK